MTQKRHTPHARDHVNPVSSKRSNRIVRYTQGFKSTFIQARSYDFYNCWKIWFSYIDVGNMWMLVTLYWRQFLDAEDRISILVAFFQCWFPTLMFKDRLCWWRKWPKPSPTSQSCRHTFCLQYLSPTSMWPLIQSWHFWLIFAQHLWSQTII